MDPSSLPHSGGVHEGGATSMDDLREDALRVRPADPAVSFVAGTEEKEESLSAAYEIVLARRLGIEVESEVG